jgi:hypothetical protein
MRSQVQVLAGPPLFSQLRGLTRLGRWRSLLPWAAPGPRALWTVEPRGLPERATRGPGPSLRAPIVVATGLAQVMVGLMPAGMALTTCGAMPQMGCTARGRCSSTDGRSRPQPACPWPARWSNRARCPSRSRIWQGAQAQAPPGRVAARRADALHEVNWCGHRGRRRGTRDTDAGRADTDAGRRTSTPGHWTPGYPDIGHRTRGHRMRGHWNAHTGHRTPDTGHLDADRGCGQGDQGTAGIRTAGPHDKPTACWTPNRVPVGAAHAALGHHSGSAVRRPASARETAERTTRQLLGRSASGQTAPRRTALLRRLRVERRANGEASSVMRYPRGRRSVAE